MCVVCCCASVVYTITYQFPGVADVVCIFAVVPESVGVPGQGGVDWNSNDLTAQREAAGNTQDLS